jgi:hypothetical protein
MRSREGWLRNRALDTSPWMFDVHRCRTYLALDPLSQFSGLTDQLVGLARFLQLGASLVAQLKKVLIPAKGQSGVLALQKVGQLKVQSDT